MKMKKLLSILFCVSILFIIFTPSAAADPIYNPGDIAVINAIIDNNGLNWTKANPADGSYVPSDWYIWWSGDAANKRITSLFIYSKGLTGILDVSGLAKLQELSCDDNELTELDVSGLTNLQCLRCYNNALTDLDVSSFINLQWLVCGGNALTELDVSNLTNLIELDCSYNNLTELDVSSLTYMQSLQCSYNNLTELDISSLMNLQFLWCGGNNLTDLDVSRLTKLQYLGCYNNSLTELDVSNLTNLQDLWCSDNNLTELDVSGLTYMQSLQCSNDNLTELDVSSLTKLHRLDCSYNNLTKLDVSGLTNLYQLDCSYNNLTKFNVSGYINLQYLYCSNDNLTELDVSGFTKLNYLDCSNNALAKLDVSDLTYMQSLECSYNNLTELDVSGLPYIQNLQCTHNALTELNVSGCTSLQNLECPHNSLTELDVSSLTNLQNLQCFYNSLTKLALNATAPYSEIGVQYNHLPNTNAIIGRNIPWDTGFFVFSPQKTAGYTLIYNANGGTGEPVNSTIYMFGDTYTAATSPAPTYGTNLFLYWTDDVSAAGRIYTRADSMPRQVTGGTFTNSNIALYAVWGTSNFYDTGYSLIYNGNDPGVLNIPLSSNGHISGQTVTLNNGAGMTFGSHIFLGWTRDGTASPVYSFGNGSSLPSIVTSVTFGTNNITIYALWSTDGNGNGTPDVYETPYTLSFNLNGGTTTSPTTFANQQWYYGQNAALPLTTPTPPAGFASFAGWEYNGVIYSPGQAFQVPNSNVEFVAQYATAQVYIVTFDANGGTFTDGATTATRTITLPAMTVGTANMPSNPTRAGYTFAGWNTAAGGIGTAFTVTTIVTGNITVYAQWTAMSAVATPTANPVSGTAVASGATVTLATTTSGATIYYTTNGANPTTSSTVYSSPIVITSAVTIKAIAVKAGMTNSGVFTGTYTIIPKNQDITYGIDTYKFINTSSHFFNGAVGNYHLSGDYRDILYTEIDRTPSWKAWAYENINRTWGGSCFGMSAVLSLVRAGRLHTNFFQPSAVNTYGFDYPRDNPTIFNLINYYQLMQLLPRTNTNLVYSDNESLNLQKLVSDLKNSAYPVIINFNIYNDSAKESLKGGHAIVGYDIEETAADYIVKVCDPNNNTRYFTLTIKKDYSSGKFEAAYPYQYTFIRGSFTVEENNYDYMNIENLLRNIPGIRGMSLYSFNDMAAAPFGMEVMTILTTNYANFKITMSNGEYAVVEKGIKTSGSLNISSAKVMNEVNAELQLAFTVPNLSNGATYTIEPTTGQAGKYKTSIYCDNEQTGYFSNAETASAGKIIFGADGSVSTNFPTPTQTTLSSTTNNNSDYLYTLTSSGVDTSIKILPSSTSKGIYTAHSVNLNVSASGDYNSVNCGSVAVDGSGVKVVEEAKKVSIYRGTTQLASVTAGHSIVFYSLGGTPIEAVTDIPNGTVVGAPQDPTRDGHIFKGWYTEREYINKWSFSNPVTEDKTLYAKWDEGSGTGYPITGKVISVTGDKRPATVTLKQNDNTIYTAYTNQNGEYVFNNVTPGVYTLVITKVSYLSYTKTSLTVTTNNPPYKNITLIPGDIDGDGHVSYNDFLKFLENYNKQGTGIRNPAADINGDGYVDYNDFITFLSGYGKAAVVE